MPTVEETVAGIVNASTWDQRVARLRLVPQHHGTGDHPAIHAEVARQLYVPHLAPDFACIHEAPFYEREYFETVYRAAAGDTDNFRSVEADALASVLETDPRTLLVFRTIVGLTKEEFAHSTTLVAGVLGLPGLSAGKVDAMERKGTATSPKQAQIAAEALTRAMQGTLFGDPPGELRSKQAKPDTAEGWSTVQGLADHGAPYWMLLHQRHYGGAFRQVLDATSSRRGDLIEDAVETLFRQRGVPYVRTGSHNQGDIDLDHSRRG